MADNRTDQAHAVDRTEHASALPIGTRVGRYQIEAVLGLGAFGITYCARDLQLEQVRNFAPAGRSPSATRFTVPHAEQVASIIRDNHTPALSTMPIPARRRAG